MAQVPCIGLYKPCTNLPLGVCAMYFYPQVSDPLKGESWPPTKESKGHFESPGGFPRHRGEHLHRMSSYLDVYWDVLLVLRINGLFHPSVSRIRPVNRWNKSTYNNDHHEPSRTPYSRGWNKTLKGPARWAPTSYKWSYKPYKWPYKWVTGVISPYF